MGTRGTDTLRDRIQWALRDIAKRTIAVKFRVQQPPAAYAEDMSDTPLYAQQEAVAEVSMSAAATPA